MLAGLLSSDDRSPEAEFLRSQGSDRGGSLHLESVDRYLASRDGPDRLLLQLGGRLGLRPIELVVVAIAAAVETDLMCGRAVAHLQAPIGGSRPTVGLLASALVQFGDAFEVITAVLTGVAVGSGLLQILNDGAPLAERALCVPLPFCLAFAQAAASEVVWPGTSVGRNASRDIPLPVSILAEAKNKARGLAGGAQHALVLRSGSMIEAKAVAREIAQSLRRRALFVDVEKGRGQNALSGLGPWLLLDELLPVFCFDLGPGERKALPDLPHYCGPQLAICGPEGNLESSGETVPGWALPVPPKQERIRLWETALGSPALAAELAGHRYSSGRIAQLGRLATYHSSQHGRANPDKQDVVAASWTAEGPGLESLAQPLPDPIPDEALVMTTGLRDELHRLLLRCCGREGLADGLGASAAAKYRQGVRALFTGPSGTGKTLASGWLATRLGLPLYRVDLAAVTSKYIGETEKNLAQLLARAEHEEVILLFDEADSMFGKRTDVRESNDRFANAQTNYLLQRIESFDGIVFLTSNSRARFDPAFFRRLDAIIEFPVPGPAERRSLWQSHLGAAHLLTQRELNQLAAAGDLLGGNVRNVVLTAAVLARAEHRPIGYRDVLDALNDEYRKLGRQVPSDLRPDA
ncbi:MAG TPA: ATP-binding protein [Xanthobacteraceae bacterium]|nr:ATP-binding protein [Xanthobacteraceae bacterium]